MRVGIVCPYDMGAPGGVQQLCIELAGKLVDAGDRAVLVGAGRPTGINGGGLRESVVPVGTSIHVTANDSVVPFTISPRSWARARRALANVDVVHVHEPFIPLVGWAGLSMPKPTVATFHADAAPWVDRLYRWSPLIGRRLREGVVTAVSETAARAIPAHWGDVSIVPNAIDVSSYHLPVGRVAKRVAFLGRDDPRKGLDLLLEAWPMIQASHPDSELVVMGADRPAPPPGVRYIGRPSEAEKRRLLASSSVYVAPNTGGESFGIVVVEAMAAGCAVVATDLPAFAAVLGQNARLVPVGDVTAISSAVDNLLSDPERVTALGAAARDAAGRFDWPVVVERYRQLYRRAQAV